MKTQSSVSPVLTSLMSLLIHSFAGASELEASLSSNLNSQSHASTVSLTTQQKFNDWEFVGDLLGNFASPYKNIRNLQDDQSASLTLTSTGTYKPMFGLLGANSFQDKLTTLGIKGGITVSGSRSVIHLAWIPSLSLKRSTLKLNNAGSKTQKKDPKTLLQYGITQSLTLSAGERNAITGFYQYYLYDTDLASFSKSLSNRPSNLQSPKNIRSVLELMSTFAETVYGASVSYKLSDDLHFKSDYYRTKIKASGEVSELTIPRLTYSLNENLDMYVEAELVLNEPGSQTYTLAFPYEWTDSLSTDFGYSIEKTSSGQVHALLVSLTYSSADSSKTPTTGNQNQ